MNYTVSCSGDVTCPPNFTTTDNTARSYTITNLTPMTTYTFSVVATNSIGSGEAGVVNITTQSIGTYISILHIDIRMYVCRQCVYLILGLFYVEHLYVCKLTFSLNVMLNSDF